MNTHKNAHLTPHGRALLAARVIDEGLRPREVAQAQGVSERTVYKRVRRFRKEGHADLQDRTSSPARSSFATDAATDDSSGGTLRSRGRAVIDILPFNIIIIFSVLGLIIVILASSKLFSQLLSFTGARRDW